jgi:hypothetical protein
LHDAPPVPQAWASFPEKHSPFALQHPVHVVALQDDFTVQAGTIEASTPHSAPVINQRISLRFIRHSTNYRPWTFRRVL